MLSSVVVNDVEATVVFSLTYAAKNVFYFLNWNENFKDELSLNFLSRTN